MLLMSQFIVGIAIGVNGPIKLLKGHEGSD
jgi:hypothetical protein